MGITAYKKAHKDEIITIPVASIHLTEAIHIRGNPNYSCKHKPNKDCCIIVRQGYNGYALVSGWADYQECVMQGYENVNAIVINKTRGEFLRLYGSTYIPIEDINVPKSYRDTTPHDGKLQRVRDRLGEKNRLDKPITIDENHYIRDGYTRYLVAKEVGMKYVPVIWYR